MTDDALETLSWTLRQHRLAVRGVVLLVAMLVGAYAVNVTWSTDMANVIAGLLVVFAGAFALVMLLVGASMGIHRLRQGQTA